MATTAATLIQRCRRYVGDFNDADNLTASATSGATTLAVASGAVYGQGWIIQIDSEAMYVTATGSGTTVSVRRGVRGTTAASHASSATIFVRPAWLDAEYIDALNSGINASFPLLYKQIVDQSISTNTATYEYTIPTVNGSVIPYISQLQFLETGDTAYRTIRDWDLLRGASPLIRFRRTLPPGTVRVIGFGPLPQLTSSADSLDALFPTNAEDALTFYAGQYLLASGEARRVRQDTGAQDARENANNVGSSMAAANTLYQRFQIRLQQSGMPPLPKNVKSVF